jgi:uncharacterized membrane protein
MHGSKSLKALAHPQLRHGRYSKYLPPRLLGRYFESLDDEKMLHLHEEIALLDTRLADLLRRVESGESGQAWGRIAEAWEEAAVALVVMDVQGLKQAWGRFGLIIEAGNTDYAGWEEVKDLVERRRKLVESERKRDIEQKQSVRLDQAMVLVQALLSSVKNHADPTTFGAISEDFVRLIGSSARAEEAEVRE